MPSLFGVDGVKFKNQNSDLFREESGFACLFSRNVASYGLLNFDSVNFANNMPQQGFFSRGVEFVGANAAANKGTSFGISGSFSGSSISHIASQTFGGYALQMVSSAGNQNGAGMMFSQTANFIGTINNGANGFFASAAFCAANAFSYSGTFSSGAKIFFGLQDISHTPAQSNNADTTTANRVGFYYSTVTTNNQPQTNWQFVCSNTTNFLQNTNLTFQTGVVYQVFIGCPPFPNSDKIFWEITNLSTSLTATGVATSNLPVGDTRLRTMLYINNITGGVRTMNLKYLYTHGRFG